MRASHVIATLSLLGGVLLSGIAPQVALADTSGIIMQPGSMGADVSLLQTDLQALGYFPKDEGITTYFGPVTSQAVISYKVHHKLGDKALVTPPVFHSIQQAASRVAKQVAEPETLGDRIVAKAETYKGDPYVWGGTSPAGFDCSGFTQYVFAQFGITLPHSAAGQAALGTPVSKADLEPGDLVFFDTLGGISHVGIYIGNDQFINAASTQVEIDNLDDPYYWGSRYLFSRRIN